MLSFNLIGFNDFKKIVECFSLFPKTLREVLINFKFIPFY